MTKIEQQNNPAIEQQNNPSIIEQQNQNCRASINDQIDKLLGGATLSKIARHDKIADKTKMEYARKMTLLTDADQSPREYCAERNLSKLSYQVLRAAMKHFCCEALAQAKEAGDDEAAAETISFVERMISGDEVNYEPIFDATKSRRAAEAGRLTKRKTLRALPADWRDLVYQQLQQSGSKYAVFAKLLHLTGARPSELKAGITVSTTATGDYTITISGSKLSLVHESGQAERTITYPAYSGPGHDLALILCDQQTALFALPASTSSFQLTYKTAAIRALGVKGKRISPYSARHQFAADLKASGHDQQAIARIMGHQSCLSQSKYGRVRLAKGGSSISHVISTITPRHENTRPAPWKEEKKKQDTQLSPAPR